MGLKLIQSFFTFMKEKLKREMLEKKVEERKQKMEEQSKTDEVLLTKPKSALSRFNKKKSNVFT